MDFSKEQRAYVRNNVYAFKVTDRNGGSFYIDFSGYSEYTSEMSDEIETLFKNISNTTYVEQYFESKDESEKQSFLFEEFNGKKWKIKNKLK